MRFVFLAELGFFFSSRRRHTRFDCDWSSDVCSSDLASTEGAGAFMLDPSSLPLLHSTFNTVDLNRLKSFELLLEMVSVEGTPLRARLLEIGRASCRERV